MPEFIGNVEFKVGDSASPETFNTVEKVISSDPVGVEREQVNITDFKSNGIRQFMAGLKEGVQFSITCNKLLGAEGTVQKSLIDDAINPSPAGVNRNMQVVFNDGTNNVELAFNANVLQWNETPQPEQQNQVSFGFKINSDIVYTES